jgi:hypothetical protein
MIMLQNLIWYIECYGPAFALGFAAGYALFVIQDLLTTGVLHGSHE